MRTSFVGKDGAISIRYDENTTARAVRLVREHRDDYESEWAAMKAISGRLGMNSETLRKWVRQAEVDAGEAPGVSSEERRELGELRRKCRELESTINPQGRNKFLRVNVILNRPGGFRSFLRCSGFGRWPFRRFAAPPGLL